VDFPAAHSSRVPVLVSSKLRVLNERFGPNWAEHCARLERGAAIRIGDGRQCSRLYAARSRRQDDRPRRTGNSAQSAADAAEAEVFRKARVLLEENGETGARLAEVDLTGDFVSAK